MVEFCALQPAGQNTHTPPCPLKEPEVCCNSRKFQILVNFSVNRKGRHDTISTPYEYLSAAPRDLTCTLLAERSSVNSWKGGLVNLVSFQSSGVR